VRKKSADCEKLCLTFSLLRCKWWDSENVAKTKLEYDQICGILSIDLISKEVPKMNQATMSMEGVQSVAYETKVILIALSKIALEAESKKVYEAIADMANAEGVILKSYEDAMKEIRS